MKKISQYTEKDFQKKRFCKNVIYFIGLPGVGKTTIAKIIAKKTGFILLDHNITYIEICRFLKKGTRTAHELNGRIHLAILNLLINSEIPGIICTMSIRRHPTSETVLKAIKLIKKFNIQVNFVRLECDWNVNKKRVQSPSRRRLFKTNTIKKLKYYMKIPCFEGLNKYPPLVINNTNMSAKKCAEKIIYNFKLQ
jgi:shikimate kinase